MDAGSSLARVRAGVVALLVGLVVACGSAPAAPPTSSARTTGSLASELDKLRARGTLVVAIRVEAPPANRTMGDPAHAQKRAFEIAVANLVATAVLGPNARVELRSLGGDRLAGLDQGADIAMTVETPTAKDRALISSPYAASAVVLAARDGGPVGRVDDVANRSVVVAMDELGARDLAQSFFQQRGISVTLDTAQGVNGAVTALEADRAVALVGDGIGVNVLLTERKLVIVSAVASRPYVIATRKNAPDVAAAVDAALKAALASGAIRGEAAKAGFPYQAP